MRPLIGITCNYDEEELVGKVTDQGMPGQDWDFIAGDYIYAIEKAGGIPVIIPQCIDPQRAVEMLSRLDGLLISGGNDVLPIYYGQRYTEKCGKMSHVRDEQDIALAKAARELKIPVLGICRGLQVMAVAFGGQLHQDLMSIGLPKHTIDEVLARNAIAHYAKVEPGTKLHEIFGVDEVGVNSLHHQSVSKLPDCARLAASEGEVVEALEIQGGHDFYIGVQWHPEMMFNSPVQQKLFAAFIKACEK